MPLYDFKCRDCEITEEFFHAMSEEKREHFCTKCGQIMIRVFNTSFMIKDGQTGPTPTKAYREKGYRLNRSEMLKKKQYESHATSKLVPNVEGKDGQPEIFDTWSEAKKFAKDAGKKTETYDPLIVAEKKN